MNRASVEGMSVKEQVLQAIQRLPDDIGFRDVAEEVAFLAAMLEAEEDIEAGRVISNEQMKARVAEWTGK
jgi:hypothetical protein